MRPSELLPLETPEGSPEAAAPAERAQLTAYVQDLGALRQQLERCVAQRAELEPALSQLRVCATELHDQIARHQESLEQMERSIIATLQWMVSAADRRDGESLAHSLRVAYYSRTLGEALKLSGSECEQLKLAGALHDAGRVEWPDTLLLKRGPLSLEERRSIETHCELARAVAIAGSPKLASIAGVIAHHHEHWDGSGYPSGLSGESIPLHARIVHMADVYDTLRTASRYKSTQSHIAACQAILQGDRRVSPDHFDPQLIDAFGRAEQCFAEAAQSEA